MPNPEISKIKLNNVTYDIKDAVARLALGSGGTLSSKFGGATYNSSTQRINFYPDLTKVTGLELDYVDLSSIVLNTLSLKGIGLGNETREINITFGTDPNGMNSLIIGNTGNTNPLYIPLFESTVAVLDDLLECINYAKYYSSGSTHLIQFFTVGLNPLTDTPVCTIDATDFIKDGMVDDVSIRSSIGGSSDYLVISFNTDSGKQDIEIPLTDFFNPNNYLDKTLVVTSVQYDNTNGKITYTKNSQATDVVTLDSTPTSGSKKPVTSGGVYTALSQKLDTYSTNNSAWDTTPTENSTKPITSGGLYTVLNSLTSSINDIIDDVLEDVSYNASTRTISKKLVGDSSSTGIVILPTATYTAATETLELVLASTPS